MLKKSIGFLKFVANMTTVCHYILLKCACKTKTGVIAMEKIRKRKAKKDVRVGLLLTFLCLATTLCFVSIGLNIAG